MIVLRQKSILNGFAYEVVNGHSEVVGEFEYPWYAQPKNARVQVYKAGSSDGDILLRLAGSTWRIRFEYLNRDYVCDYRYSLETMDGLYQAEADVLALGRSSWQRRVNFNSFGGSSLGASDRFLQKKFVITDRQNMRRGEIREKSAFSLRRELVIDVPSVKSEIAAFMGIVALIVRF